MGLHPIVVEELERNRGLAAIWALRDAGARRDQIRHATAELRMVHGGVLLSGHAPLTDWQQRRSATLTAPGTWLAEWSGGSFYGFRGRDRWPTTVKRFGNGGPRLVGVGDPRTEGSLKVFYSEQIEGDTHDVDEIPMLLPGRTLLDLTGRVSENTGRRYMRDALRLKVVSPLDLQVQVARHHGRRGIVRFRDAAHEYGELGMDRSRSDAESLAISLLAAVGVRLPVLNAVVAGEEADLVDYDQKLIVELDGPQYHLFVTEDARKQAAWEKAGWVVRRLPTDAVYDEPHRLIEEATRTVSAEERTIAAATRGPADVVARLERRQFRPNVRKWGL